MRPFAIIVRKHWHGLWYACALYQTNGSPTRIAYCWARTRGAAVAEIVLNLEM